MQYIVKGKIAGSMKEMKRSFDELGGIVELSDEALKQYLAVGYEMEMDHTYEILKEGLELFKQSIMAQDFYDLPIVIAYFDEESSDFDEEQYIYHINSRKWEKRVSKKTSCMIVKCKGNQSFFASDYLFAISQLHEFAAKQKRRLVIWGNIQSRWPYYRRDTITNDLISAYIKKYKSLFLQVALGDTQNKQRIEGAQTIWRISELEDRIRNVLDSKLGSQRMQDNRRGSLLCEQNRLMRPICEIKERSSFCHITHDYSGKQVWIGIVTHEHGHYEENTLRDEIGKMRVVGVWEQEQGEYGRYLSGKELVTLKGNNTSLDHMLHLIGGNGEGVATSAQMIIGKVKKQASERFICWEDLKATAEHLAKLAKVNQRFMVLLIPYENYLLPCKAFKAWLEAFAKREGLIVICPAGDRGDKRQTLFLDEKTLMQPIHLLIKKKATIEGQLLLKHCKIGDIYLNGPKGEKILLKPSRKQVYDEMSFYIEEKGETKTGETLVFLSMENLQKGKWQLQLTIKEKGLASGNMILQTSVESALWLSEAKGKGTLSHKEQKGVISVGCFDQRQQVLYSYSGRGDKTQYPTLVLSDDLCCEERWESTLTGACVLVGIVACLIEKLIAEEKMVGEGLIKKRLLWECTRQKDKKYPDYGEGYGILEVEGVRRLLRKGNKGGYE